MLKPSPQAERYLAPIRDQLRGIYGRPDRHYHNLRHIDDCLRRFEEARDLFDDPIAAELAIWFHDAVYDPTRPDNEALSADLADDMLQSAGAPPELLSRVRELILATRHDAPPTSPDAALVMDIDLAILGAAPKEFGRYERAIRQEYAHIPEADFASGRRRILQRFLDRPTIYHTAHFRDKYEAPARENLRRSIDALTRQRPSAPRRVTG